MANEQAAADSAYTAFQKASELYNKVSSSSPNSQAAYQARQALTQAEAASNTANDALKNVGKTSTSEFDQQKTLQQIDNDAAAARAETQRLWEEKQTAAATQRQQDQDIAQIQAIFKTYGLNSLYDTITNYVRQGYTGETVALLLRETPEYKQRFPAMAALSAKNRAITEAEYINYETTAAGLERRYGLPEGMLMGNVTSLLTNEVSASELNDRVILASSASIQAPQELKDQFKDYYGIDQGGMTAYFLDPAVATPLLEKQFASAVIGAEATRQGVGLDVYGAENLQNLGISQAEAAQGFSTVAAQKSLSTGVGDVVSQQELIAGNLTQDAAAKKSIERAVGGRLGKFQGGGEFLQSKEGAIGLGTAATR